MQRPIGVTVLSISNGLQGLLLTLVGIAAFLVGGLLIERMRLDGEIAELLDQLPPGVPEIFPRVLGGIFLVMALANAAIAVGLWLLQTWADRKSVG